MNLKKISIQMFRNIRRSSVEFDGRFNIFHGKNGQGKTNYLEAIYFLGILKSFRNAKQREMLAWNESASQLECLYFDDDVSNELAVTFENSLKNLKVNSKAVVRIIDYCKMLSVVAFSPDEITMLNGPPEQRRRYLDRAIFSSDATYLKLYHDYFRVLKQRNQLLKQRTYAGIEAWTDQLASTGARLIYERAAYISQLSKAFSDFYRNISGSDEDVRLCYHCSSYADGSTQTDIIDDLLLRISLSSNVERDRGTTVIGPHRDDLDFYLNGRLIREHGSQGQQKSFVLSLKMAEIDFLSEKLGKVPILLLDDMTAELDRSRIEHLIDFLVCRNMQVFISTTDSASVPLPAGSSSSTFLVENGRIV